MSELSNIRLTLKSNVYFDGKCVSHTLHLEDGSRKTVGVLFPSTLQFKTEAAEVMELISGQCRVRLDGATEWVTYEAGQSFSVPAHSGFEIESLSLVDYVCHFGG